MTPPTQTYIERLRQIAHELRDAAAYAHSQSYYSNLEEPFATAAAAAHRTANMLEAAGDERLMADLRTER